MGDAAIEDANAEALRQSMELDVVGVGFGPAMGGFLTTLSRELANPDGTPRLESTVTPGIPLQVICYERADDISFGVSGVVSRARGIGQSFPDFKPDAVPLTAAVGEEQVLYLLDPIGASRRSRTLRAADAVIRSLKKVLPCEHHALRLPYIPPFLRKDRGYVFSIGQFNQWVGSQIIGSGLAQIWPGMPAAKPLIENDAVVGVRLLDQGTDKRGVPADGYLPGMDIRAKLTVVADGPVGAIGKQLEEHFGLPAGHHQREWAVGAKMVVELPENCELAPGTVIHTFGFPEPEIFGFLYVYPERTAAVGIFVPSTFESPVRTSYRYLQHWMMHPYLWRYLKGGKLRSWGAKSLQESGRLGEPHLVGDGYARIGEGSGSTNVLTGSGVDEAWTTGVQLAEAVAELVKSGKPFSKENLEATYVARRRASWVEKEGRAAERARDGFRLGVIPGLLGMALAGISGGRLFMPTRSAPPYRHLLGLKDFYQGRIPALEIDKLVADCKKRGVPLHDTLMERAGWPSIPYDGTLLVSQQDALLLGGKVQAAAGYSDHVTFLYPELCKSCSVQVCVEACSGEAIRPGDDGVPGFDREKCVHCGACLWNCSQPLPNDPEKTNIRFGSGAGGLHSYEN
jgi:electron-transferring-flavoprotein dehydrogenase